MRWIAELMKRCLTMKYEVVRVSKEEIQSSVTPQTFRGKASELEGDPSRMGLIIVGPEIPNAPIIQELLQLVPSNIDVVFVAALKRSTAMELSILMAQNSIVPFIRMTGRHLIVDAQNPNVPEAHDEIWTRFQELLKKDGFPVSWEIQLNNGQKIIYDVKIAKETETQHNIRGTSIGKDDQTDLHIMLEASQSVDQFLEMLDGKPFKKLKRRSLPK
jgi:hypothetical protein